MSAREDYPAVAFLADAAEGRTKLPEAVRMFHEIEELRLKVAWLENIAEGRGEENERLRVALFAITRGRECTTYTKGNCRSGTGRTRDAQYESGRWCAACIANDAMGRET